MVYTVLLFLSLPLVFAQSQDVTCTICSPWYLFMQLSCPYLPSVIILLFCSSLLNSLYLHALSSKLFSCIFFLTSNENTIHENTRTIISCFWYALHLATCSISPLRLAMLANIWFFCRPMNRERCHWELHSTNQILGWMKTMTIYQK